ncbi:polysaccharide deacetylase family protein [Paraburkholderia elongata]|nr:polysaccharide deacetylase family protein [Paraburkholderia elongata]
MNETEREAWLPRGKRVSVCVTLDNLGEACDINMGRWPVNAPIGQHYTATRVLPRVLTELDGVPFTYFIEAVNVCRYPEQLRALRDADHEVALHSWGHENWGRLSMDERRSNLAKSVAAFRSIGVEVTGFRPPGGAMDAGSFELLRESGFTYCSPVSDDRRVRTEHGLTVLPFAWRHVDAYLIDPDLAAFRMSNGDPSAPANAVEWSSVVNGAVDEALRDGLHLTVIFHPYVFGANESLWEIFTAFVRRLRARDDVWFASCREVAERRSCIGAASPPA